MRKIILLSDHVIGYARETVVSSLTILTATVIYVTLKTHQQASIVNIGTVALPAPRIMPAIQWEKASRQ